jgi:hypothetical protein
MNCCDSRVLQEDLLAIGSRFLSTTISAVRLGNISSHRGDSVPFGQDCVPDGWDANSFSEPGSLPIGQQITVAARLGWCYALTWFYSSSISLSAARSEERHDLEDSGGTATTSRSIAMR